MTSRTEQMLVHYAEKDLGAAVIFTILALIVAAAGVAYVSTGAGTLLTLGVLLIIASGMVGLFMAVKSHTRIGEAAWYELFIGFFAAIILVALVLPLLGTSTITQLLAVNSPNVIWNIIILVFGAFVSLYIMELIGWGVIIVTGKAKR